MTDVNSIENLLSTLTSQINDMNNSVDVLSQQINNLNKKQNKLEKKVNNDYSDQLYYIEHTNKRFPPNKILIKKNTKVPENAKIVNIDEYIQICNEFNEERGYGNQPLGGNSILDDNEDSLSIEDQMRNIMTNVISNMDTKY